jgi:hypothetical protein
MALDSPSAISVLTSEDSFTDPMVTSVGSGVTPSSLPPFEPQPPISIKIIKKTMQWRIDNGELIMEEFFLEIWFGFIKNILSLTPCAAFFCHSCFRRNDRQLKKLGIRVSLNNNLRRFYFLNFQ